MARSWRNFFRKSTDEEQEKGPAVASEPATEDVEEGNGHHPVDLEPDDDIAEDVPTAEEVQAERKEPAAEDVWEVEEPASGESRRRCLSRRPSRRSRRRGRCRGAGVGGVVRQAQAGSQPESRLVRGPVKRCCRRVQGRRRRGVLGEGGGDHDLLRRRGPDHGEARRRAGAGGAGEEHHQRRASCASS